MQIRNTLIRYGAVAKLFHWTIVVLIIVQFVLADKAEDLPRGPALIATLALHKSIGITILLLAILRLTWRLMNPVPPSPPAIPRWQNLAAHLSHWTLYGLLFVTPLLGWMMSSARNYAVSWFGLFTLPDLVGPDRARYEFLHGAHELMANAIFYIAIIHAAAALKHHFIDRDDVLKRMLPGKH